MPILNNTEMPKVNAFPDLGRHFQLMKIKDELLGLNPEDGLLTMTIVKEVEEGKLVEVVKMIKEKATENPKYMEVILGPNLLRSIQNI